MKYLKDLLSNYKFDPSKFKLGMRTLKTGLSVFLVLLLFHLFGWEGLQIGTLTAVFSLRESLDKSVHFGFSRIVGNSVGGLLSLLFFLDLHSLSKPITKRVKVRTLVFVSCGVCYCWWVSPR